MDFGAPVAKSFETDQVEITITVPRAVVDVLNKSIEEIVEDGKQQAIAKARWDHLRRLETVRLKQNRAEFYAKAPVVYRTYRRSRPAFDNDRQAIKFIAVIFEMHPAGIEWLVTSHKRKVKAYIQKRRIATAKRLVRAKQSIKDIAAYLGCSPRTVNRLVQASKAKPKKATKKKIPYPVEATPKPAKLVKAQVAEQPQYVLAETISEPQSHEARAKEFRLKTIQMYRMYRRIIGGCEHRSQAISQITKAHGWPFCLTSSSIAKRSSVIKGYIRERRVKTIRRLYWQRWSDKAIAEHLDISIKTVQRHHPKVKHHRVVNLITGGANV